ncbi:MAG: CxxxxCH/CxxCH domain-containing protein [Treponema sp.]|nr:CxxxxCH/CxxCH domain-containing protein [Treponema sp.]
MSVYCHKDGSGSQVLRPTFPPWGRNRS